MAEFKPTWLYIKQHHTTGLKYFGKTTLTDPYKYNGSGSYWLNHLAKHGKDVVTIWCRLFTDKLSLTEYATNFSIENNIVESAEWANLIPEAGHEDGGGRRGCVGKPHTEETKQKIRDARALQPPTMLGKTHSEETKQKIRQKRATQLFTEESRIKQSNSMKGHIFTFERNQKISNALTGRILSDDHKEKLSIAKKGKSSGELNAMFGKHHTNESKQKISEALVGRIISDEWRQKSANARIGQVWWNNSTTETRSKIQPGETWKRGRISHKNITKEN